MRRAYLELHLAVLLFGFTAILGKLITLPATSLVWWRVLIAAAGMLVLVRIRKTIRELPCGLILKFLGIGGLVALHWMTFFASIKAANASVALVTMATAAFFTSILEPLLLRRRAAGTDMFLGILMVPAMMLIVRGIDPVMHTGIWLGLVSAFLVALFASLNKLLITRARPLQISFFELCGAWIGISCLFLVFHLFRPEGFPIPPIELQLHVPHGRDWIYLLILGLICTTLAYVLAVKALHHLSAFATGLVINLEPVYGIFLAWVILGEDQELTPGFYVGVVMIILVVFSYPFFRRRQNRIQ